MRGGRDRKNRQVEREEIEGTEERKEEMKNSGVDRETNKRDTEERKCIVGDKQRQ